MSFRYRILAVLLVVGLAPVLLLGWTSLTVNREELLAAVGSAQVQSADDLADSCQRFVLEGVRSLRLSADYIPFDRLSAREAGDVLHVPLRQIPWLDALALLDASGNALAPPAWAAAGPGDGTRPAREPVSEADLDAFAQHVPLEAALASGAAIGPPFRSGAGAPRLAVAVRVGGEPPRILAAELGLDELRTRLVAAAGEGGRAFLVGPGGELVVDAEGRQALDPDEAALVAEARGGRLVRTVAAGQTRLLAAFAPVSALGWGVVAARPADAALRATARVRRYTLFWAAAALVLTGALGLVLARSVAAPVARLSAAAHSVTAGDYGQRVEEGGAGDELSELARSFNHMTSEVRRRDAEIRAWNAELASRVEEKAAALRGAQDQIARSRRLAALGSLSAGVAHALNNPMTSVMGLVALVRQRLPEGEEKSLLGEVLGEARRATRVVQDLRRFAEQEREGEGQRFGLDRPVLSAIDAFRARLREQGIALEIQVTEGLPAAQGRPEQIEQLVSHLIDNATAAMPKGGTLGVSVSAVDGQALKLCISDSGVGIPPEIRERIFDPFFTTKRASGVGMGLSLTHTIVEAHHGTIAVESAPGQGTRFTVVLPAAPPEAHLS
jgi:signal transduction histidine kinase